MGLRYNPFTGSFDLTRSPGSYLDGEVAAYGDLPLDTAAAPLNSAWLVRGASGLWLLSRKPAGIYIRTATGGADRNADYTYAGTFPDVFSDANFVVYNDTDSTKNLKLDTSAITTGTTRTLTVPDKSGTIATTDASDLTSGTLADARLSSNVALKDAANTFSANQTLNGTNNVAPNQTAASGSSIMTRDLTTAHRIVPVVISGAYTGRLYSPTMATHGMGQGNIRGLNIPLPACTIDRVGIAVSSATANGLFRLGVYNTDAQYYPTTLIADFGTVATDTTGFKELTVSQSFSAGVYYFALFSDTAPSSLSYWGIPDGVYVPFIRATSNGLLAGGATFLMQGQSSGSMPATHQAGLSAGGGAPYFSVRFA